MTGVTQYCIGDNFQGEMSGEGNVQGECPDTVIAECKS